VSASFGRSAVFLTGGGTRPDRGGRGAYTALVRAAGTLLSNSAHPPSLSPQGAMSRPILERLGFSIVGWFDCLLDDVMT
jgi:hypothetical protein